MQSLFDSRLEFGCAGESLISKWLRKRGNTILPVYEKIINDNKGPQIYLPNKKLIAPDLFVFNHNQAWWIEAKHKTAFTLHRLTQEWVTGIDIKHYEHYLDVQKVTPWDVWLLFLHRGGKAKDSPESPSGLFGNILNYLSENEHHRHENWGKSGMVYWSIDHLKKLAELNELIN